MQGQQERYVDIATRSVLHADKANRQKKRRTPKAKHVHAFVLNAAATGAEFDPANMKDDDWDWPPTDEEGEAGSDIDWDEEVIEVTAPKPKLRPVVRRRQMQRIIPEMQRVRRNADGAPELGEDGEPLLDPLPLPESQAITEDFTRDEIEHLNKRHKQQPGEPLDAWLVRMVDQGADTVMVDFADIHNFARLSLDPEITTTMRQGIGEGENGSLLGLYGAAVGQQYPLPSDWPAKKTAWFTLKEAGQMLKELGMRDAIGLGTPHLYETTPLTRGMRDALVNGAPPAYKGVMLTLSLSGMDLTVGQMVKRIRELAGLGDWSAQTRAERPREQGPSRPRGPPMGSNTGGAGSTGLTRRELWQMLLSAGVRAADIDGVSTGTLAAMCREKGLLKGGNTGSKNVRCAGCHGECGGRVIVLPTVPSAPAREKETTKPPSDEEEENDTPQGTEVRVVRRKRLGKKAKTGNQVGSSTPGTCYPHYRMKAKPHLSGCRGGL
ncbi:hypothetical protein NQD34_016696 [Periophthalmus magnuspinnatus]|nr:hypothetical protein NQD34_016696 [Periophthalmus magnuspinnatus]